MHPHMKLFLASKSPRRRELLANAGFYFEMYNRTAPVDAPSTDDPAAFVVRLAELKAAEPVNNIDDGIVLTADTIVYIDGKILEKPVDRNDAAAMLKTLQGATHYVYTGLCVSACPQGISRSGYERTGVTFAPMTDDEIAWYIASGEYHDKAGAYAIQGRASRFIKSVSGCYFNVVGLPLHRFYILMREIETSARRE